MKLVIQNSKGLTPILQCRGHRVCLLIGMLDLCASGKKDQDAQYESNDEGEEEEEADRQEFTEYKQNLQQLFEEQLSGKHKVYLHQLGSERS